MSRILEIDFKSKKARKDFVISLSETGFAVIKNHNIDNNLITNVYKDWKIFFSSDNKEDYLFDYKKQDGYFPYKSENAKGYKTKDLKEFFHIYRWGRYPSKISNTTKLLHKNLLSLGSELLDWLDELAPENIRNNFSMKLSKMITGSGQNLLRIIHYPPINKTEIRKGEVRAAEHTDINLITILIAEPGLQVKDSNGMWKNVKVEKNTIVVNIGDMLQEASKGFYKSTPHRVINPEKGFNRSRFSMPLFIHPRDNVKLSERFNAKQYLEKRLQEIGLK